MKNFLLFISLFFLLSCSESADEAIRFESYKTTFYVEEIQEAKYTRVKGYIYHNNLKVPLDNGSEGYYYKKYKLLPGDKIPVDINVLYYSTPKGYKLVFGDVFLKNYYLN